MIQVGDKYRTTAVNKDGVWGSFGIDRKFAHMWGRKKEEIRDVELTVKEVDIWLSEWYENNDENAPVYFGYYDYKNGYRDGLMWLNAKVYNCCFTYGADNHCWKYNNGTKTDERIGTTFIFEVEEKDGNN